MTQMKYLIILISLSLLFPSNWIIDINNKYSDAIVQIVNIQNNKPFAYGSGFIIDADGVIITNFHVIEDAHQIFVATKDEEEFEVRGYYILNENKDYAILKIAGFELPIVELGNSKYTKIGDEVLAIGHPQGLSYTVTDGIISQIRNFSGSKIFQMNTAIDHGSSGGPLFNKQGQVIGITSAGFEGEDFNFAIPINYINGELTSMPDKPSQFNWPTSNNLKDGKAITESSQPSTSDSYKGLTLDEARQKFFQDTNNIKHEESSRYNNGRYKYKGEKFINEKKQGHWVWYFENGNKDQEGLYEYHFQNGYYCFYHETGHLETEMIMNYGKIQGVQRWYYEDGNLKAEVTKVDGLAEGTYTDYYPSGQIQWTCNYLNNEKDGIQANYHENGEFQSEVKYKNGKTAGNYDYVEYYANGQIDIEGEIIAGKEEGIWISYYENGQIKFEGEYIQGEREGYWVGYFINGVKSDELNYIDGKINGEYLWYHEDGYLQEKGNYQDDLKTGKHKRYYESGALESEFGFNKNGELHGERLNYYESGTIKSRYKYYNNLVKGQGTFYHPNGKISEKGKFKNDERAGYWKFYDESGKFIESKKY